MDKIISVALPHDLPENWNQNHYVSPGGVEVGLTEKHGFNYLMKQVNNSQVAAQELETRVMNLTAQDVNAAPSGHGSFGEVLTTISATTESAFETAMNAVIKSMANYTSKRVVASLGFLGTTSEFECVVTRRTASSVLVQLHNLQDNSLTAQKLYVSVGWQALEWATPLLEDGVEYRTTEKINGKAVFKKMVSGVLQYRLYGETDWKPYRNTLGAAPHGYYEDVVSVSTEADMTQALKNKAYAMAVQKSAHFIVNVTSDSLVTPKGTWYVEVTKQSSELSIFTLRSPNGQGMLTAIRHLVSATMRDYEWVNPPLVDGVEYRTTERLASKSVFKKNVSGVIYYRLEGETQLKPYAQAIGAAVGASVANASVE